MTTDLDPPAVPPLTSDQHDRLRRQVMARTAPTARSAWRWVAPIVAVGAVGAVAAGAFVLLPDRHAQDGPAANPTPSPTKTRLESNSTAVPDSDPQPPRSITVLPFPKSVDLGPVPSGEARAAAKSCKIGRQAAEVIWGRRVPHIEPRSRISMLIVQNAQGVALCQPTIGMVAVAPAQWATQPDARRPLVELGKGMFDDGPTTMYRHQWTVYRARPGIARIESRYVWNGGSEAWITGVVADGFAYTDVRAIPLGTGAGLQQELRAYDAAGRPVDLTP